MTALPELMELVHRGEDSYVQHKREKVERDRVVAEMLAFANTRGGRLIFGFDDDGNPMGLSRDEVQSLSSQIANWASDSCRPPLYVETESIEIAPDRLALIVKVAEGVFKPYMSSKGVVWVKEGPDIRMVSSRSELLRLYQETGLCQADEQIVRTSDIRDLDADYWKLFFHKVFNKLPSDVSLSDEQLLTNMNFMSDGHFNYAGLMFLGKHPQFKLPMFGVKAVVFNGNKIEDRDYIDRKDFEGKLSDIYEATVGFIVRNIRTVQVEESFNSRGEPEIPRAALEEVVANALVHRDLLINAPIRVFIFRNRVEVISPGRLPNSLTVEKILMGNTNARNPVLGSFAKYAFPYSGIGSGVRRVKELCGDRVQFENDVVGNQFKVMFLREEVNL